MTRTILGITTGLFAAAAFFVPAAEACISCEYVPSVVHSVPSKSYGHERSAPRRAREVFRELRAKKKSRVTETKPSKVEKVQKADKPEKVEKVQKAEKVEKATPAAGQRPGRELIVRSGDGCSRQHAGQDRSAERPWQRAFDHRHRSRRRQSNRLRQGGERRRYRHERDAGIEHRDLLALFPHRGPDAERSLRALAVVSRAPASM